MQKLLKKYKIELDKNELEKFEKFLELFMDKNSKINLSAIREKEAIIEKHFIDSIMLNIFVDFNNSPLTPLLDNRGEKKIKILDLWTGWGFPLIPLAIINPEVDFVWLDSVWKKLKAVEEFAEQLELKNVSTINWRAEEVGQNPKHREKYDYVVSRATAYLPTLLEFVIPLLKVWGIFVAYKLADKEELRAAKKAFSRLSSKIYKVKNYEIDGQRRTLIIIEKLHPTHKKFPRKIWIPLAKPIS